MHKLVCDAMAQSFDPLSMLLGPKFLDLGLREIDKDLNRRIKLFQ